MCFHVSPCPAAAAKGETFFLLFCGMEIPDEIFSKHKWEDISVYLFVKRTPDASVRRAATELDMTKGEVEWALRRLRGNGFLPEVERKPPPPPKKAAEKKAANKPKPDESVEERKKKFVEALKPHLAKYGRDMLNDFYTYWTQINPGGKRMLYEKQEVFEMAKRLATWYRKSVPGSSRMDDIILQDTEKDYTKNLW